MKRLGGLCVLLALGACGEDGGDSSTGATPIPPPPPPVYDGDAGTPPPPPPPTDPGGPPPSDPGVPGADSGVTAPPPPSEDAGAGVPTDPPTPPVPPPAVPGLCEAQEAEGERGGGVFGSGPCDATGRAPDVLGYAYNGTVCLPVVGCSCIGADCGELAATSAECQARVAACVPPPPPGPFGCLGQDARGDRIDSACPGGGAPDVLGYAWNGSVCLPVVGCACVGISCADLAMSAEACQMRFAACVGPTPEPPPPPGGSETMCFGFFGGASSCGDARYCNFPEAGACGRGDFTPGTCTERPRSCAPSTGGAVCGCDGWTYESECLANQAGQDILSRGPCR